MTEVLKSMASSLTNPEQDKEMLDLLKREKQLMCDKLVNDQSNEQKRLEVELKKAEAELLRAKADERRSEIEYEEFKKKHRKE